MLACLDCPVNKQVEEGQTGGWCWNDPSGGLTLAAKIPKTAIEFPAGSQRRLPKHRNGIAALL
jgi:hypothetical protein